ncbi:hypothetical protein [Photorhabdus bodei]|nr:hypothetical protein [Photorhabdus bodei]
MSKIESNEQWNWPSAQLTAQRCHHTYLKLRAVARQLGISQGNLLPVFIT